MLTRLGCEPFIRPVKMGELWGTGRKVGALGSLETELGALRGGFGIQASACVGYLFWCFGKL